MNTEGSDPNTDPSVHLTVGVDTHIWGLNFASLRANSLKRSGLDDKVLLTKLQESVYWDLQVRTYVSRTWLIFIFLLLFFFI